MEEGVYLAYFALGALSRGLTLFLMTHEWNHDLSDLSLVLSISSSSNYHVPTLLFSLHVLSLSAGLICLMSRCSTILCSHLKVDWQTTQNKWNLSTNSSELQITPTPMSPLPLFLIGLFFKPLSRFPTVRLYSCVVHSLSAFSQRKSQRHAAKACVRSHLPNHLHPRHRGWLRKRTIGALHQFEFLSPLGCHIVISSSLSRRDFLAVEGCMIGCTKTRISFLAKDLRSQCSLDSSNIYWNYVGLLKTEQNQHMSLTIMIQRMQMHMVKKFLKVQCEEFSGMVAHWSKRHFPHPPQLQLNTPKAVFLETVSTFQGSRLGPHGPILRPKFETVRLNFTFKRACVTNEFVEGANQMIWNLELKVAG